MLTESDGLHKIKVGVTDFFSGVTIDHTQEEGDNAFHDESIALGTEGESAICILIADNPHTTLATVDEIGFHLLRFGESSRLTT